VADDLTAGHAGIDRALPFGADVVEIGMADAAVGDVGLDLVRSGLAAFNVDRFERLVAGESTIGFDDHMDFPHLNGDWGDAAATTMSCYQK
jgi:hypothetical protein